MVADERSAATIEPAASAADQAGGEDQRRRQMVSVMGGF